jgi:hypothetical protein
MWKMFLDIGNQVCCISKTIFRLNPLCLALGQIAAQGQDIFNTVSFILVQNCMDIVSG